MRMLRLMAVADAYAVSFEYAPTEFVVAHHQLSDYVKHHKHNLLPGHYSDDTQMSIAVAEVICARVGLDPLHFAEAFVRCFKRDPREGYAKGFYKFLCEVQDGAEFLDKIKSDSDKSGGAMRALPCGIFPNIDEVVLFASAQACITHGTENGVNAAIAAALMSHYFIYDLGPKEALGEFIAKHVPGSTDWSKPWTGPVGQKGVMSVHAAITAIVQASSLKDLLDRCVRFTGDVDTVAALALGAAGQCKELPFDLPSWLFKNLEKGPYGYKFLARLDASLAATQAKLVQDAAASARLSAEDSSSTGPRIVAIPMIAMWTGATESVDYLEIPRSMDLDAEEKAWFAQGGDSSGITFVQYLVARGAKPVNVETWHIRYQ